MNKPTRRAGVITAVMATGLTALFATSASAIEDHPNLPFSERDEVLIDRTGYDVAGDGFTDGAPDAPAILTWDYSATFGTSPSLTGKIHFDGVENCARVLLISYNDGVEMQDGRTFSDEECPATPDHYARNIELDGEGPLRAHYGADQVEVVLQTEASEDRWVRADSQTVTFGPELDVDLAQIRRAEFDVGNGNFVGGSPEGFATVTWVVDEFGKISPRLIGTLYANEADDSCVIVQARYKDGDGDVLETRDSDEHCPDNDDLYRYNLNMGQAYSAYAVRQVTYAIIKDGDQVGATTVVLGDSGLFDPPLEAEPFPL